MPFDPMDFFNKFTVQVGLGPMQLGVIGATIMVVNFLKASPLPTPVKARPWIALGIGLLINGALEFALGTFHLRALVAEQAIIWFVTLGIHGFAQSQTKQIMDPRDGRDGDPRRP